MSEVIVVVDYNNPSRAKDVRVMTSYARERYGINSVLIRSRLEPVDRELADHVLELDTSREDFAVIVRQWLTNHGHQARGIFPFSDRSIIGASKLAESLGLPCDSSIGAQAALSKLKFRASESALAAFLPAQGIFAPRARRIESGEELRAFAESVEGDFILKPACEGNNRGVLRLSKRSDLAQAFREVERYLAGGLICEELIPFPEEYSYDGIGHLHFITEKLNAKGRYPVERGQRVPARPSIGKYAALRRAGQVANLIVGQCSGPFHNEIKFDPETLITSVVEPNRRPAGMMIWDLAEKVFGTNFYRLWIDQVLTGRIPGELSSPRGAAAIRMLGSPSDGYYRGAALSPAGKAALFERLTLGLPGVWFGFEVTASPAQAVVAVPRDNAGFLGSVCIHCPNGEDPDELLDLFEERWLAFALEQVEPVGSPVEAGAIA